MVMQRLRVLLLALAAVGMASCAQTPLDIPPEEWARLTPDQQNLALAKQAEVDALTSKLSVEASRNAALTAISESTRQVRVDARRERARLGDILECVIDEPTGDGDLLGLPLTPKAFSIVRGESKPVGVDVAERAQPSGIMPYDPVIVYADYADSGLVLRLCSENTIAPGVPAPADRCAIVAATFRGFSNGIERTISIPDTISSAAVRCVFAPGPPVQVIETGEDLEKKSVETIRGR